MSADSVVLDLDSMEVGQPYEVTLGGVELIAVKYEDGSVGFYSDPTVSGTCSVPGLAVVPQHIHTVMVTTSTGPPA